MDTPISNFCVNHSCSTNIFLEDQFKERQHSLYCVIYITLYCLSYKTVHKELTFPVYKVSRIVSEFKSKNNGFGVLPTANWENCT